MAFPRYLRYKKLFTNDIPKLPQLLEEGKLKPLIMERLPLLEANRANELLESGQANENMVLLAPELL